MRLSFAPPAHRGGEPGGEIGFSRRREIGLAPIGPEYCPVISSPLTVSSPNKVPRASVNLNTSPATVPVIGPDTIVPAGICNWPLTFGPCCYNSSLASPPLPVLSCDMAPRQTPDTSTVTSVRSIQSVLAQPIPTRSVAAMRTTAKVFIHYRGGALGRGVESMRRIENVRFPTNDSRPIISSPLTLSSPSTPPSVCLKRNTSPVTVPAIGPVLAPALLLAVVPVVVLYRIESVTLDPVCSNSKMRSLAKPPSPATLPYHVPVTSTVTSVRSIQSCFAQP
jgi:hypothetical protein